MDETAQQPFHPKFYPNLLHVGPPDVSCRFGPTHAPTQVPTVRVGRRWSCGGGLRGRAGGGGVSVRHGRWRECGRRLRAALCRVALRRADSPAHGAVAALERWRTNAVSAPGPTRGQRTRRRGSEPAARAAQALHRAALRRGEDARAAKQTARQRR
jgi:hypothetical protein